MYCGSLFVWKGGRTMEVPPTFVAGSGVQDCDCKHESESAPVAKCAIRAGHPRVNVMALNLFAVGIV